MTETTRTGFGSGMGALGAKLTALAPARRIADPRPGPAVPDPLPPDEFELISVDVGDIWMSRRDEVMRPYMQRARTWEPEEGRLLRSFVTPGCRFLDIGANVGYFSVLVGSAAPGVTVDSVEPDPGNVRALRFNLWSNRINGTVWPLALDSRDRFLALSGNEHNFGDLRSGRIEANTYSADSPLLAPQNDQQKPAVSGGSGGSGGWVVPAASGDELFAGRGFDLVKIDVQGWEFDVILGLDKVLLRSPGVRIVTEFWPAPLRAIDRSPTDILARYRQLGYRVRVAMGDDIVELTDDETVAVCDSGGPDGQVNLLLERG